MDRSPDPHLPEERDRISGELSDRAFPFVVFLKKADEDQATRVTAVFTYWFEDAYDGLLENYPRSASPAEQATKEAEFAMATSGWRRHSQSQPIQRAAARRRTSHFGGGTRRAPTAATAKDHGQEAVGHHLASREAEADASSGDGLVRQLAEATALDLGSDLLR